MVSDEELIERVNSAGAHPDVEEYIRVASETGKGTGMLGSLRHFAENSEVSRIATIGTALEKEIWENGVRRLVEEPDGEPYSATPDKDMKRVLEAVYEEQYI